jgi:hypothetical protein
VPQRRLLPHGCGLYILLETRECSAYRVT